MGDTKWSKAEKKAARKSFDIAYNRECTDFIKRIKLKAENLAEPKDIWELHDFMTKEIKNIEKLYDYRYSILLLVFARLIKDSWLTLDEVKYLSEDKLERLNEILRL